jgi:enoyl-CoA hydratase/carnithine racemase
MSADITLPAGAPEEVVTNALVRDIDLAAFGGKGVMALITLDNGLDHNRPNTFGAQSVKALDAAITEAIGRNPAAIAITGKPFIFAAGADLSALSFLTDRNQSLAIGKLGHDVFRRLGESKIPTFAFINGLALGGGLEVGLHCHYRTVASTAFTALPEVFLGLVPGWGGATILPKLIGPERAVQVIMLNALNNNTMMKAKDALKLGVVDAMFEPADFIERSIGFAVGILNGTTKIERADYSNDPAWESALATGKAAALKKYGGATTVTLGYVGQQSNPYTYVVAGDLNGDRVSNNDLLFVPRKGSDVRFSPLTVGTTVYTEAQQQDAFDKFISQDSYLSTRRGKYAERNASVIPFLHRLDLSVAQDVFLKIKGERNAFQIRFDILNFTNMVNKNWGVSQRAAATQLLNFVSRDANNVPLYRLSTQRDATGTYLAKTTRQFNSSVFDVWTAQLGLRYTFGK